MTLKKIFELGLINELTEIFIRKEYFHILTHGNWCHDDILKYQDRELTSFVWQDNNKIFIDLK